MWCFRYRKLLMPYVEGATENETSARVRRHLEVCPKCRMEVAALQCTSRALRSAPSAEVEAEANPALWVKVEARLRPTQRVPERRWNWQVASAVAAAAMVLAIVGTGRDLFLGPTDRGERGRPGNVAISELKARKAMGTASRVQITAEALFVPASEAPRRAIAARHPVPIEAAPAASPGKPQVASAVAPHREDSEIRSTSPLLLKARTVVPVVAVAAAPVKSSTSDSRVANGDGKRSDEYRMASKPRSSDIPLPVAVTSSPLALMDAATEAKREFEFGEEPKSVIGEEDGQPTSVDVLRRSDKHEKRRALFRYP